MKPHLWHHHPGVRSGQQLTRGERAADVMRNGMGSWGFVIAALAFLAGWMASGGFGIDALPYILLNLCLSCLAALQGSILLIASKRSDQISSELAKHDFEVNQKALQGIETLLVAQNRRAVPLTEINNHTWANELGTSCYCGQRHIKTAPGQSPGERSDD